MSSISVSTYTRTHTATHIADAVLGSIASILATLGVDATQVFADWDTDQQAISAWIVEGSLSNVILECHQPDGSVEPVFEFPVAYESSGEGDRKFTADRAALARYMAKLRTVPAGSTHRIFCTFSKARTPQPGWGSGNRASVTSLRSYSFGTLASGPHATAGLRYFTK